MPLSCAITMFKRYISAPQRLGIPDYRSDRVCWNTTWDLNVRLGKFPSPQQYLRDSTNKLKTKWIQQQAQHPDSILLVELCVLQRDLIMTARDYAAGSSDVESKWTALSPMARQAYILEGLVRTAEQRDGFEDCRIFCPEVNLIELQKDGGRAFTRLLTYFMHDSRLASTRPLLLPFPPWDDIPTSSDECYDEIKRHLTLLRNIFICEHLFILQYQHAHLVS